MSGKQTKARPAQSPAGPTDSSQAGWMLRGGLPAWGSGLALLAAFPPLGWYPLAWLAPLGWLWYGSRRLPPSRRDYFVLWLSGLLFWLVTVHSVRLAFWALYVGWILMACYLACYIPLFVGITRRLIDRWRWPLWLAAPVSWTGGEWIRGHLFSGYAANTLAHSQAFQPLLIQPVDQLGTGGLGFLMMLFAALLLTAAVGFRGGRRRLAWGSAAAAALVPVLVGGYGVWRLRQAEQIANHRPPLLHCLLLQENTPSVFEMDPDWDDYYQRAQAAWTSYANLCRQAARQAPTLDLVIWPESTFTATTPLVQWDFEADRLPESLQREMRQYGLGRRELIDRLEQSRRYFDVKVRVALLAARGLEPLEELPADPGPDLLVGCDHIRYGADQVQRFNSAVWIRADGTIADQYDKMHLVMFGEYIPLRPLLSWLGDLFSFAGTDAGDRPKAFEVSGAAVVPSICFESMLPHLITRQLRQLRRQGSDPQILINLTNDSWFKGTSMLDHHLASSIVCSVESRRPMLVAANTGLSAEIDGSGRVLQCSTRLTAEALLAQPRPDGRWGLVQAIGYPLSWICSALTVLVLLSPRLRSPIAWLADRFR